MRRLSLAMTLAVCLLSAVSAYAVEPHHDLLRVPLTDPSAWAYLNLHRNEFDIVHIKPGAEAHIAARPGDEATLRAAGLATEVIQRDMELANAYPDKGSGFGIFHTYSESVAFMDSLRVRFPTLISAGFSIGTTFQGRTIWAYRVSDNAGVDESEPEVLIDGTHHAREIMAAEFPIMFAEYLLTHYATDPEIKWLVDNRELYLVPIVNPDGFIYNETTNPNGGGQWRKNRSPQAGGQIGVDLNRNYPNHWGYDDVGSSPTPADITYRGPSPASELETQAMINFTNNHEFITHDSVHTYSGLTLYPWGYVSTPTAHDLVFSRIATEMVRYNGYTPGQPGNVLYTVNGGIFDTFYGTTTGHPAIYSMSNEIGTYGFWPPESNRGPEFQENVYAHLYLMRIAGPYLSAHTPVVNASAKTILPGQSGTLSFSIENQSVATSALGVSVTVTTSDPWVQFQASERSLGSIASLATATLAASPIPFTVDAACPAGHQVTFTATVHMGSDDMVFPLSFPVGTAPLLFSDTLEAGTGNWTLTGNWATTTTQAHSPTRSLTDTPAGIYANNASSSAQLNGTRLATKLRFWHRYSTESGYDYGKVQVSANGGAWTTLTQYSGLLTTWTQVTIDLGAYTGQNLAIRFLLTTDSSVTDDGWYIDDVELDGMSAAFAMAQPVAISPVGGAVTGAQPELLVSNSSLPSGTPVYGFRVYRDAACTDLAASIDNVAQGAGQTAWTVPTLVAGNYWWRAWAGNGTGRTNLTAPEAFVVSSYTSGVDLGATLSLRVLGNDRLRLTLPARADVTVDIHDARGARVQRLFSGSLEAGERALSWDGRDTQGRTVASGVYFVRALVGGQQLSGRLVVVR
jgi:hypothetical protein